VIELNEMTIVGNFKHGNSFEQKFGRGSQAGNRLLLTFSPLHQPLSHRGARGAKGSIGEGVTVKAPILNHAQIWYGGTAANH
jgi:hypothetical protein